MELKPGDKAPGFTTTDQQGNTISLSDYKGKKVVLYFYPKDDTEGCTAQACNIRDNFSAIKKKGIVILGASTDDAKSHQKFEKKYSLPFTLLADTDKKVVNDYGVWGLKKFMGREYMGTIRTTFLINEEGYIDKIIDKVDTKNHTAQIMEEWGL
ncbi:MAG: thioredoxin-dependent thiol peroxidase [Taibaiella sp.]|nr:thioredoxin-dependent thiol peroxidase [Taibaiella sp.]